jgi:hypothetical protein
VDSEFGVSPPKQFGVAQKREPELERGGGLTSRATVARRRVQRPVKSKSYSNVHPCVALDYHVSWSPYHSQDA